MTATAAAAAATRRLANPYAKRSQTAVNNSVNMSPQSQQRISNQHKRKYKLCSNSQKWQKGDQLTLEGGIAFEATRDCIACKARHLATFLQGYRVPNRPHHVLCVRNTKTRGKGEISDQQRISLEDNKRYKNLAWLPTSGLHPSLQPATIHNKNIAQNAMQKHRPATYIVNACFISFLYACPQQG